MQWRKAQKLFIKKPYLMDPYRIQNNRAARRQLYADGLPRAFDVLDRARLRANLTPEKWEKQTGISLEQLKRKCRNSQPIQFGSIAILSRQGAIAFLLTVLFIFFMAFTAPGRTLATCIYNAFSEIVNGILHISAVSDTKLHTPGVITESSSDSLECSFDSVEALCNAIDYPVYCLDVNGATVMIQFDSSPRHGDYIESSYVLENGIEVNIIQLSVQDTPFSAEANIPTAEDDYLKVEADSGIVIEGTYTKEDSVFFGATVTDFATVHYVVRNCADVTEISEILQYVVRK